MVRPKRAHLDGARLVLEVAAEPVDELGGEVRVGDVVDGADDLLGVPGHAHLAVGVAGVEQADEAGVAPIVEAFVRLGQQAAGPTQRVVLSAPVADGVVLHPPAALVELGVGQLHEIKGVGDLDRVFTPGHAVVGLTHIPAGLEERPEESSPRVDTWVRARRCRICAAGRRLGGRRLSSTGWRWLSGWSSLADSVRNVGACI
jgi:hypothetical protein